jgi:hypothetical protein
MNLSEYIQMRWDRMTPQAKQILNLPADQFGMLFLEMMWTKQFYGELISGLQVGRGVNH